MEAAKKLARITHDNQLATLEVRMKRSAVHLSICFVLMAMTEQTVLAGSASSSGQPPGTKRMAERLEKFAQETDPMKNPFLNTQRVEKFRALLAQATDPVDIAQTQWQYASELVKSGHVQEAIMQFKKLEEYLKEGPVKSDSKTQSFLRISLAIAHLRAAGKQNQEFGYNLDSVLLPIRSSGVYRNQEAS
ncbi:MAG: hypothetical protein AAB676_18530, partial [Verrucomicrobiota bacterium]